MAIAEAALQANHVPVHCEARPGIGHGIDQQGLAFGAAALKQSLAS
jgi:hypothetical protein